MWNKERKIGKKDRTSTMGGRVGVSETDNNWKRGGGVIWNARKYITVDIWALVFKGFCNSNVDECFPECFYLFNHRVQKTKTKISDNKKTKWRKKEERMVGKNGRRCYFQQCGFEDGAAAVVASNRWRDASVIVCSSLNEHSSANGNQFAKWELAIIL